MTTKTELTNPYIGLRTYEETDAPMFRGRAAASAALFAMIAGNDVVVLHAESGEGKSSLVNAGLSPLLRDERYVPVRINFTEEDFVAAVPDFDAIVSARIADTVAEMNDRVPGAPVRVENLDADAMEPARKSAWWTLRNTRISIYGATLTPVLVFDQFEEVFTRGASVGWTEDFFVWLSRTLSDDIPTAVVDDIRCRIGEDAPFPRMRTEKGFKALFSLRTEFMGELDYWAIQRHHIAVMKNSRYCLKPLTDAEADEVLALQPAFSAADRELIKQAVCADDASVRRGRDLPVIPAMLLSVISTTASAKLAKEGKTFNDLGEITGNRAAADLSDSIIGQFYDKEIKEAGISKQHIRVIENVLVNDKGKRARIQVDSTELDKIDFRKKYKPILEEHRLIKCQRINGEDYVELTHDALARVIAARRNERADNKRRWLDILLSSFFGMLVLCGILYWYEIIVNGGVSGYGGRNLLQQIATATVYAGIIAGARTLIRVPAVTVYRWRQVACATLAFAMCGMAFILLEKFVFRPYLGYGPVRLYRFGLQMCVATPVFAAGYALWYACRRHRWVGAVLVCLALLVPVMPVRIVAGLVVFVLAMFYVAPYAYTRENNEKWIGAVAIVLLAIADTLISMIFVSWRGIMSPDMERILGPSVSIVLCAFALWLYGGSIEAKGFLLYLYVPLSKERTWRQAMEYILHGRIMKDFPLLQRVLDVFLLFIVAFVAIRIGNRSDFIVSLVSMPVVAGVGVWLALRVLGGNDILRLSLIMGAGALAVGLTQLLPWQGVTMPVVVFALMAAVWVSYIRRKRWFDIKDSDGRRMVHGLVALIIAVAGAYVCAGYNIFAYNGTMAVMQRPQKLMINEGLRRVRDSDGRLGAADKYGNLVVPTLYDKVVAMSDERDVPGFILVAGEDKSVWHVKEHLNMRNVLTDKMYARLLRESEYSSLSDSDLRILMDAMIARVGNPEAAILVAGREMNRRMSNLLARASANQIESFSISDTTLYNVLHEIDVKDVPWWLLSYTNPAYQEEFLERIVSRLSLNGFGQTGCVMADNFEPDKWVDSIVASEPRLPYFSDEVKAEDAVRYALGEFYSRLGGYYAETGQWSKASAATAKALRDGRFAEPALVDNLVARVMLGEDVGAELTSRKDEPIRVNKGLEFPDPAMKDAERFLRYKPLGELCAARLEALITRHVITQQR